MDLFGETSLPENNGTSDDCIIADTEEGGQVLFAHPRQMTMLEGHENVEQHLAGLLKQDRMPHGVVLNGPKGIGKATFAYRLARFILKYGGGERNQDSMFDASPIIPNRMDVLKDDRVYSLVASGGHPDILTIERAYDEGKDKYAASVSVADIRKVEPFLRKTSSEGGWRIVIIDDADTMNRNAQNALLKILEEPPHNALLLLVTHRVGALIPTIKSRTQSITMSALPSSIFKTLLKRYDGGLSDEHVDTLYHLTKGSLGSAIQYVEQDALEVLDILLRQLQDVSHWDWDALHKMGTQFGKGAKEQHFKHFSMLLCWIYEELVRSKALALNHSKVKMLDNSAFPDILKQSSLEKLLETCDKLNENFLQVERANLDKKQAVLRAFSIISA